MLLTDLIKGLVYTEIFSFEDVNIENVYYDSRKVTPNSIFVCITGYKADGHDYAQQAVRSGAKVLVVEKNCREALALIAANFYNRPADELTLVGVTGTNGKTTITHLVKNVLQSQRRVGIIGTIGVQIGTEEYLPINNTSPESLDFQCILQNMQRKGVDTVVTEVSSHGLIEHRVDHCDFDFAIFSNLTQDHLDFHGTMENYFLAKAQLFTKLKENGIAIINIDDPYGLKLISHVNSGNIITYGLKSQASVRGKIITKHSWGTTFSITHMGKEVIIDFPMIGEFNVLNALAASAVAIGLGYSLHDVKEGLEYNHTIPGRLERVNSGQDYDVYIDFAHTPDGLEKVLGILSTIRRNKLITVFGCTGESDTAKRPIMAQIVEEHSDLSIVTTDNPKYEEQSMIFRDVIEGFQGRNYRIIEDREEAVHFALSQANKGDIVLIAGKGHEDYQLVKGIKVPYSDKEVVKRYFALNDIAL